MKRLMLILGVVLMGVAAGASAGGRAQPNGRATSGGCRPQGQAGTVPLSVVPQTAVMEVEEAAGAGLTFGGLIADTNRFLRTYLMKIDRPEGDQISQVVGLRDRVYSEDLASVSRHTLRPMREP